MSRQIGTEEYVNAAMTGRVALWFPSSVHLEQPALCIRDSQKLDDLKHKGRRVYVPTAEAGSARAAPVAALSSRVMRERDGRRTMHCCELRPSAVSKLWLPNAVLRLLLTRCTRNIEQVRTARKGGPTHVPSLQSAATTTTTQKVKECLVTGDSLRPFVKPKQAYLY